jgi:hypothetical protein
VSWLSENKELVSAVGRLLGIGLTAILATGVGTTVTESRVNDGLRVVEAQAAADTAKAEKYGAFDNVRDYIVDVEKQRAGCDVALELYDENRTTATWRVVLLKCHTR